MDKKIQIIFITIIIFILFNIPSSYKFVAAINKGSYPYQPDDFEIINALAFLKNKQSDDGGIGGISVTAWAAMAISASGDDLNDWDKLISFLEEKSVVLDPNKATDWERHTLAIIACDKNPRIFAGINFIEKIISFYDGNQIGDKSILYDDYFGIISLVSAGMKINDAIIQNTKSYIISYQDSNGGWGDADSTAAAIIALISAGEDRNSKIITNALNYLKTLQTNDGGFHSWGETNAASTSWAVMAISATGNNPTSSEWKKNGNDPITYLISLQKKDGSFNWTKNQSNNPEWMTSYAIPALLGKFYPIKINESGYENNNPPNKPSKPNGPIKGETDISYTFKTSGTDPDNDRIQYLFDWGDGSFSDWTQLFNSGKSVSLTKKWNSPGIYSIRAQVKDVHGLTSEWSNVLNITISKKNELNYWTGSVRIEGKNKTIWKGSVKVYDTYFHVKNVSTEKFEEHYISYPNVIGALDEAAKIGDFSYFVEYLPDQNLYLISKIENNSNWWYVWIDYELQTLESEIYEIKDKDTEILFGYIESRNAHALKIAIDKSKVKKNEDLTVSVCDENGNCVENSSIFVDSKTYKTNEFGNNTFSFSENGLFEIFSEKNGFVRSNKKIVEVIKNTRITKPISNSFYFMNLVLFKNIKKTWVIGAIDIEVETSEEIKKVDFYINDKFVYSDNSTPFEFRLNEKSFFNKTKILVKSYKLDVIGYRTILKQLIKIVKFIRNIYEKHGFITRLGFLKNYYKNIDKTKFIEEDIESIEIIVLNLLPYIHKY